MQRPPLSIITVTYNSGDRIWACLRALWPQLRPDDEVMLVDNASTDDGLRGLAEQFPTLRVIRNSRNVGYAAANNQALALARGEYILLLNPDVILEPNALDRALAFLEAEPAVGILGPKILLPNGRLDPPARRTFKTAATYVYKLSGLSWLFPRHPRFGHYYLSYLDEDELADVDAVVGAFLLIRRQTVAQIGPLDERFFMYCEDEDWCWRARHAGWRVVYHPGVLAHHYKGSSARSRPFAMIYHWHRSIFLFHRKHLAARYPLAINGSIYVGMGASFLATVGINAVRRIARRLPPLGARQAAVPVVSSWGNRQVP
ncbi:MAG TPA: glycosyltransferase family 2 protein [Chloroflexota bacterium]|nr:glycosyltransferase family 2 protein [Chloroflexota bacterium]